MSSASTQQPIRALYVLDQVNRGGTEMQALDALRIAQCNGLDLTVVTTGGQLLEKFQLAGEVHVLKRRWPIDLAYASQIRRIVKERNCSIVQGHQGVDGLHLLIATRRLPVKRVLAIEGFIPDLKNRRSLKFLIPRMDAVAFPSKALQAWIAEHDDLDASSNSVIVTNGADPARLNDQTGDLRAELGLKNGDLVIGMTGNFYRDPRKDQLTLIKALPEVISACPNTYCLIVGGVETGAEYKFDACKVFVQKNGIADRVYFLGSRSDIPAILDSLDLFVFSSLHEGGSPPIAVIEAMLSRVPVVVSNIPPHTEYLSKANISVPFKTGDERDLAQRIIELVTDHKRRSDLAKRAFDFAVENFSTKARLAQFTQLYERLLSE